MESNWIKDLNLNSYISLSTTPCQRRCSIASLQKEFQVWKAAALPVSCFAKTHPADANTFHFTLAKATTIFLFIPVISFHIWQQKYQSDFQINQTLFHKRPAFISSVSVARWWGWIALTVYKLMLAFFFSNEKRKCADTSLHEFHFHECSFYICLVSLNLVSFWNLVNIVVFSKLTWMWCMHIRKSFPQSSRLHTPAAFVDI